MLGRSRALTLAACLTVLTTHCASVAVPTTAGICLEHCPDGDDHGACPPSCLCNCQATKRTLIAPRTAISRVVVVTSEPCEFCARSPVPPEPRAIWHVPIARA